MSKENPSFKRLAANRRARHELPYLRQVRGRDRPVGHRGQGGATGENPAQGQLHRNQGGRSLPRRGAYQPLQPRQSPEPRPRPVAKATSQAARDRQALRPHHTPGTDLYPTLRIPQRQPHQAGNSPWRRARSCTTNVRPRGPASWTRKREKRWRSGGASYRSSAMTPVLFLRPPVSRIRSRAV